MIKEGKKHYYLLPGGLKVRNMKEGCQALGIGSYAFRSLVKKDRIKKIHVLLSLNPEGNELESGQEVTQKKIS